MSRFGRGVFELDSRERFVFRIRPGGLDDGALVVGRCNYGLIVVAAGGWKGSFDLRIYPCGDDQVERAIHEDRNDTEEDEDDELREAPKNDYNEREEGQNPSCEQVCAGVAFHDLVSSTEPAPKRKAAPAATQIGL